MPFSLGKAAILFLKTIEPLSQLGDFVFDDPMSPRRTKPAIAETPRRHEDFNLRAAGALQLTAEAICNTHVVVALSHFSVSPSRFAFIEKQLNGWHDFARPSIFPYLQDQAKPGEELILTLSTHAQHFASNVGLDHKQVIITSEQRRQERLKIGECRTGRKIDRLEFPP
jgi:hypothetical protein